MKFENGKVPKRLIPCLVWFHRSILEITIICVGLFEMCGCRYEGQFGCQWLVTWGVNIEVPFETWADLTLSFTHYACLHKSILSNVHIPYFWLWKCLLIQYKLIWENISHDVIWDFLIQFIWENISAQWRCFQMILEKFHQSPKWPFEELGRKNPVTNSKEAWAPNIRGSNNW